MSLGFIGYCKKTSEDDTTVYYAYSGSNWNNPNNDSKAEMAYDGELSISKSVLAWERTKAKQQTEYIHWTSNAIEKGDAIIICPCKNAFTRYSGNIDYIASKCFQKIFKRIYQDGAFPDIEGFMQ